MQGSGIQSIEIVLLLLLLFVAGFTALARKLQTPYPIVLVLAGLVLSLVPGIPRVTLDPDLIFFAERNNETLGFSLSLPDVNQAFAAGPRIPRGLMNLPIALWNLLTKKKAIDTVRILVLGVAKEHRNRGIDAMFYRKTIEAAETKGYTYGEASWILEDNDPMNRACEMMNGKRYKVYRVYGKQLG